MLNFGDIFYTADKEYVWLFADGETIYAAMILDQENAAIIKRAGKRADKQGNSHQQLIYCYVELTTEDYIDCAAHVGPAAKGIDFGTDVIRTAKKRLNNDDLRNIRQEIIDSKELFRAALVEHVESITI